MEKKTELYLVSLTTGKRIVVSIDKFYDVPIGEKKRIIVKELNEKLGAEIVRRVSFYGFADVDVKDKFMKHKK